MKTNITLLTALLLIGCGTRKAITNKSIEKESSKVEVKAETETVKSETENSNVKTTIKKETNEETGEEIIEETVEPKDNNKPATYTDENGKIQTLNNTKKTTKKTKRKSTKKESTNKNIDSIGKTAKNEENKAKIEAKEQNQSFKKAKPKEVVRNNTTVTIFLIIGIGLVIGFILWWIGKRFKKAEESVS